MLPFPMVLIFKKKKLLEANCIINSQFFEFLSYLTNGVFQCRFALLKLSLKPNTKVQCLYQEPVK